jgi:hypothetical protein
VHVDALRIVVRGGEETEEANEGKCKPQMKGKRPKELEVVARIGSFS